MKKLPTRRAGVILTTDQALDEETAREITQRFNGALEDSDELDQWRGRAEVAEAELGQALTDLADVTAERDDLSIRSLPHLDTANWPPTDEPAEALIGDELADKFGGWW
jgi:hypothetical protein